MPAAGERWRFRGRPSSWSCSTGRSSTSRRAACYRHVARSPPAEPWAPGMMTPDPGRERGPSAAWRALAVGWLDEQPASAGIERTGEVQQPHLRPWATVLTAPTTRGPVWLKGALAQHRIRGRSLRAARPDPPGPCADADRGRSCAQLVLLPDGGPPARGPRQRQQPRRRARGDPAPVRATAARSRSRSRPAPGPRCQRHARRDHATAIRWKRSRPWVTIGRRGQRGDEEARERVAAMGEAFASWCQRLASLPGMPSVDHNDLHPVEHAHHQVGSTPRGALL